MNTPVAADIARRNRLLLGGLLALSLAVRVWTWLAMRDTLLFNVPYLDSHNYDVWARALVAGDWGRGQPYWMGPLYPHLLALSYAVFGVGSAAMMLGQWLLTLLNIVLVHRLARRWTGETGALIAAALYAGYGPPVFYAGLRLMATLVTTLAMLIALQADRAATRPTARAWLGLGLLVGLAATARGNILALLPLLLLLIPRGRRRRLGGLLWLGAALAILPVTVRNLTVGGDAVLLTSNAGVNLLIGQQDWYGGIFGPIEPTPQFEFDPSGEVLLEADLGREMSPSDVSRELTRRAILKVWREPGAMVGHYARKAYRFWSGYELPQIVSWNVWRHKLTPLALFPVPFVLLVALGLTGAVVLGRPARRVWLVLVGGWFLGLLPFFPTARYRQPVAPLLAITAAAWLLAVIAARRDRRPRRLAGLLTAAALLTAALWPSWSALDPVDELLNSHLANASRAADIGDRTGVLSACVAAEAVRPGLGETSFRRGGYLEKMGDHEGALAAYEEAARRLPDNSFVLYRRARALATLDRHHEALVGYAVASDADPDWAFPWHGRALSLRALGRDDEAVVALQRAIELDPGRARYRSNLASMLAELGRLDEAAEILEKLTDDFPGYAPGWFNLALVRARLGDDEAARRALGRAAALPRLSASEQAQVAQLERHLEIPR